MIIFTSPPLLPKWRSKLIFLWLLQVTLYLIIFLLANAKAARILGIFPTGAKSHFEFNKSIMKSLHAAGHEITIISPFKETEPLENITFISMSLESLESTTIKGSIENFVKLPLFTYFRSIAVINQRYCENFSRLKYRQVCIKVQSTNICLRWTFSFTSRKGAPKFSQPSFDLKNQKIFNSTAVESLCIIFSFSNICE